MALTGYRMMWMMVLFDLPVINKKERKAATSFRNFLLDEGFEMSQFSVYMRFCAGKEQLEAATRRIQSHLPPAGKISIMSFTDKQYANTVHFHGCARQPSAKNPQQYVLF